MKKMLAAVTVFALTATLAVQAQGHRHPKGGPRGGHKPHVKPVVVVKEVPPPPPKRHVKPVVVVKHLPPPPPPPPPKRAWWKVW